MYKFYLSNVQYITHYTLYTIHYTLYTHTISSPHTQPYLQVLKALRGVVFKETGCYLEHKYIDSPARMGCFPFVEPFVQPGSGSGSVAASTTGSVSNSGGGVGLGLGLGLGSNETNMIPLLSEQGSSTTTTTPTTPYAFGDGTVTYALRRYIPGNILK